MKTSVVWGNDPANNLKKVLLKTASSLNKFKSARKVLLKPNLTSAFNPEANTSAQTIRAVLNFFSEFDSGFTDKIITIGESSGEAYQQNVSMREVFKRFGYYQLKKDFPNLSFTSFDLGPFSEVGINTFSGPAVIRIPKNIKKYDYTISLTLPKTHDSVVATLSIKNYLMGIIKSSDKVLMHGIKKDHYKGLIRKITRLIPWQMTKAFNNYAPSLLINKLTGFSPEIYVKSCRLLHQNILHLAKLYLPDLAIIDGSWIMEGNGPVYGRLKKRGFAIASIDPVKADILGAEIMGVDPSKVKYLWLLQKAKGKSKEKDFFSRLQPHRYYQFQLQAVGFK